MSEAAPAPASPPSPGNCDTNERFSFLQEENGAANYSQTAGRPVNQCTSNTSSCKVLQWSSGTSSEGASSGLVNECVNNLTDEEVEYKVHDFKDIREQSHTFQSSEHLSSMSNDDMGQRSSGTSSEGIQISSRMSAVTCFGNEDAASEDLPIQGTAQMFGGILLDGVEGIPAEARGNITTFFRFMKSNQHVVAIQTQCCIFLVRYAGASDEFKARAASSGAISALLQAISKYMGAVQATAQETAIVLEVAIWTLTVICAGIKGNAEMLAQANGPQLVAQAMMKHLDAPGVQEQGCWLFASLARLSPSLCAHLRTFQAEEIIKVAWHAQAAHPGVCTYAHHAFTALQCSEALESHTQSVSMAQELRDLSGQRQSTTSILGGSKETGPGTGNTARFPLSVQTNKNRIAHVSCSLGHKAEISGIA